MDDTSKEWGVCVETLKRGKPVLTWWAYKVSLEGACIAYERRIAEYKDRAYLVRISAIPYSIHACELGCPCIASIQSRSEYEPRPAGE